MDKKVVLFAVALLEGMMVMSLELVSTQMAIPYYGNALPTWSAMLGVTLTGLMAGYYGGGWLTQRFWRPALPFWLILGSTFCVLYMLGVAPAVLEYSMHLPHLIGVTWAYVLYLLPALVLLGALPPVVVQYLSQMFGYTGGYAAGLTFGLSTVGNVFAAFLLGFFLLPLWGYMGTICVLGGLFVSIAFIYFLSIQQLRYSLLSLLLALTCVILSILPEQSSQNKAYNTLYESQGILGNIRVVDVTPESKRVLFVNDMSQSHIKLPHYKSTYPYVYRLAASASVKPPGSDVLVAGLAGGSLINELTESEFNVDVVEIDPRMEQVAKQYFNLSPHSSIYIDDFRHYINTTPKKYDVIIIDISLGATIPHYVYTKEAFQKVYDQLKPKGFVLVHLLGTFIDNHEPITYSVLNTLQRVGFYIGRLNKPPDKPKIEEIVYGAKDSFNINQHPYRFSQQAIEKLQLPKGAQKLKVELNTTKIHKEGKILADNRPLLEMLHLPVIKTLKSNRPDFSK
jgi:spermidine synthase